MTSRIGILAALVIFAVAAACGTGLSVLNSVVPCGMSGVAGAGQPAVDGSPALRTAHGEWDAGQIGDAATIVAVGAALNVPSRGWVIAVATAMQESALVNTPGGDRDSVGLFQQRPSQGWGSPEQLLDPAYAAGRFYARLLTVPGWQILPLTDAAQAVQHSATPDAYATWETDATTIVAAVGSSADRATSVDLEHCPSNCPAILSSQGPGQTLGAVVCDGGGVLLSPPAGFSLPPGTPAQAVTAIGWALQQLGTPYSFGGDCTAAHSGDPTHECDCSSLVQVAYRAAGISLPRTAAEQSRVGALVSGPEGLRPGDLLFVPGSDGTVADPGHVGMYVGDGLLVSAPQTGQLVRLSPLTSYWLTASAFRRVVGG